MLFYHIWTLPILTNIYVAKTKQRMADTHLSIETTYIAYPICYTMMLPNMPFRKADAHPLRLNTRCKDLTLVPSSWNSATRNLNCIQLYHLLSVSFTLFSWWNLLFLGPNIYLAWHISNLFTTTSCLSVPCHAGLNPQHFSMSSGFLPPFVAAV